MPDRLDAMHAFVVVCDLHGFAPAARQLGLSPSTVTRMVAGIEDRLGVRLLHRTTRTLRLTEPGTRFLERTRRILADLDEANAAAQGEQAEPRGRVVVAAPLLFGRMHVAPVVSNFLDRHRLATAELILSDRFANLVEDGIDVAIRIGALTDSNLVARRLGLTRRMLVAAPAYLAAHGTPSRPSDLAAHRMIAFRTNAPVREWLFRSPADHAVAVDLDPHLITNSAEAALEHASIGGGITTALCYQVGSSIASGRLLEVLPAFAALPVPIQAVFPTSRLLSAKVRAFLELALQHAGDWQFTRTATGAPSR